MAVAFSTDSSAVFQGDINVPVVNSGASIFSTLQLESCKTWIKSAGFKKIALQFPDDYLHKSSEIVRLLEEIEDIQVFVLADTSYGSCCVDEVAAEHGSADCMIHVGHSCLSPTKRLPVMYVFAEVCIEVEQCCDQVIECLHRDNVRDNVILVCDVNLYHCFSRIGTRLEKAFPNIVLAHLNVENNARICTDNKQLEKGAGDNSFNTVTCAGRILYLPENKTVDDYTIIYVGAESMTLTNLMMTWNKCTFYRYDPESREVKKESLNVNKLSMKRYFLVEKAKDAHIVGILVGTLGVANYIQIIQKMKALLKKAGKKYYTFVVGKLNVAKLANFMEIDVYVYISCGENTLLDSKDFYRPIVTPYEMEMACNPEQQWTGSYVMEFQQLLPGGEKYVPVPEEDVEGTADISLISGELRHMGVRDSETVDTTQQAVVHRDSNLQVANTAGEFLSNRSWRGLDPQLGQTPVTKATKGKKGIAIQYESEPT